LFNFLQYDDCAYFLTKIYYSIWMSNDNYNKNDHYEDDLKYNISFKEDFSDVNLTNYGENVKTLFNETIFKM